MNKINSDLQLQGAILEGLNGFINQGIFTTDTALNILSWNHWLEIHTGYTASQAIGQNLLTFYPDICERRLERFYYQALEGQVVVLSQRFHRYLIPLAPTTHSYALEQMQQSVRIAPLMTNGRCIGTISFIDDVSDRVERETELQHQIQALKIAEEALLTTYRRLQHLISFSPVVIYTCQASHPYHLTFVSDNVTEKLGYTSKDLLNNPSFWTERIHPEDAPYVLSNCPQSSQREHLVKEYRFRHADGTYRWLRDEMKLVQKLDSNTSEIIGAWYDISHRKLAEEQLREQAALLDITTDAILVRDLKNRILFWNKGAEDLYGWTAQEALDRDSKTLLYQEVPPKLVEALEKVMQRGEWQGELHQVTKEGREIIVESRWTLVYDRQGKPQSVLVVNTDITQKKQLEAQFLRIQRLESIGTLANGIAHDLNNVLTPILSSAQLLKLPLPPEKKQQLLGVIETSAKRGGNLIKQVLSFSKGLEGQPAIIQMRNIIVEIEGIAQETFPKFIEFKTNIPSNLWTVTGDPTQLHQVLMNLCVNARDAMPTGGTLMIQAENMVLNEDYAQRNLEAQVGPYIRITVADTGMGIPPAMREKIFEPFFTTKEFGKGTGLGLSTVLGIVRNHKGFVMVESDVGQGTKFQIYLPAAEGLEKLEPEEMQCPKGRQELILVVDDEQDIRDVTKITLEKYGYQTIVAKNGMDAVALYQKQAPQIRAIILDIMMPQMDGVTAIQKLTTIDPQVKIIATSGSDSQVLMKEVAKFGVKIFLTKPYSQQQLLNSLKQLTQE